VKYDFAKRGSHGDLDQAGVFDLSGKGKDLGPAAFFGADTAEPRGAVVENNGDIGESLNIVDDGGFVPEAMLGGIGRPNSRLASLTFDGMDQGGFFAADKSAGAEPDFDVEGKVGAENIIAQQAVTTGLINGVLDTLDRHWIFGADIEKTAGRPDGERPDQHAFKDGKRIAFEHGAIHKCAGVALIGVADDILNGFLFSGGHAPFDAGRIPAAAATADFGFGNFTNDRLGVVAVEGNRKGLEAPKMDIFLNAVRINDAAVSQRDSGLAVEKSIIAIKLEKTLPDGFIGHSKPFNDAAGADVKLNNLVEIGFVPDTINDFIGPNEYVGDLAEVLSPAQTEAVGANDGKGFGINAGGGEFLVKKVLESGLFEIAPATDPAAEKKVVFDSSIFGGMVKQEFSDGLAAKNMTSENLMDDLAVDPLVFNRNAMRKNNPNDRLATTATSAARPGQGYIRAAGRNNVFLEFLENIIGAGGVFACGRTDLNGDFGQFVSLLEQILTLFDNIAVRRDHLACHAHVQSSICLKTKCLWILEC
jgi:hypothetical protein